MTNKKFLDRFNIMIGTEKIVKLINSSVIIFGVGGVGGSVANMLVRSGIGHLTIVDFDTIDETNINRQLVANYSNIGRLKVEAMKEQLLEINPDLDLTIYPVKLDESNLLNFGLDRMDYIVDCIDDVKAKKLLIKHAFYAQIPILSAMGAGNRYLDTPNFEIVDIKKTSYDPLAKIIRKYCADEGIKKLNVCYTRQKAMKFDCKTIGSVVYYPMSMACAMVQKVVCDIIA